MLKLILIGPPGAGKGTQAKKISQKYEIDHISTGDILRENIRKATQLGKAAKSYIENGQLVPDELLIQIIYEKLDSCKNGFLLDGFPRNVEQAEALQRYLDEKKDGLSNVLLIETEQDVLIERITGRRTCKNCGAVYHITQSPPKIEGSCDLCGANLYQREDDKEDTLIKRLNVFMNLTAPVINYYKKRNIQYCI